MSRLSLVRDEQGLTLIELLVTMVIGMVVLSALLSLTEVGARSTSRTVDRAETTQRSRTAMTLMTQGLRAQVCPSATKPPIATATKDTVTGVEELTFFGEVGELKSAAPSPRPFAPQKRRLTFDPRNGGSIVENVWDPARKVLPPLPNGDPDPQNDQPDLSSTTDPPFKYPVSPSRTRTLATQVARIDTSTDFFQYYGYESASKLTPVSLSTTTVQVGATPIPANSIAKVVRIEVSFKTRPSNGNQDALRDADLQASVQQRNTDFTDRNVRTWGPRCG